MCLAGHASGTKILSGMKTFTVGVERRHEREVTIFCPIRCLHPFARFSSAAANESLGNLAQYPPERTKIKITTADNGTPLLQPEELVLNSGQYYRLTIDCPDVRDDLTGWRIEMPEFLNNAHLRLVTVGDIEVHLQGLSFNAIECDEIGAAHVSFVPIKPVSIHSTLATCRLQWVDRSVSQECR